MPARKITDELQREIREIRARPDRPTLRELAARYGVTWNTIRNAERFDYRLPCKPNQPKREAA